jgi:hypothetical protein
MLLKRRFRARRQAAVPPVGTAAGVSESRVIE